MKKFFILITFITLCSCNNYLDKSITEELTVKELKKIIKNDSSFYWTYDLITNLRTFINEEPINIVKYDVIKYKDVIDAFNIDESKSFYENYPQVDSIRNSVKDILLKAHPDSLINIKLITLKERWPGIYYNPIIKITGNNFEIKDLGFRWWIGEKIDDYIPDRAEYELYYDEKIKPNESVITKIYTNKNLFDIEDIKKNNFTFNYELVSATIIVKQKEIDLNYFLIHYDDLDNSFQLDYYIKEYFDENYITFQEYNSSFRIKKYPLLKELINEYNSYAEDLDKPLYGF